MPAPLGAVNLWPEVLGTALVAVHMRTVRHDETFCMGTKEMKKLIALTLLTCASAHAEFFTGNDLLQKLNGAHLDQMVGLGYVMGVFDATRGAEHCPPDNITAGQVKDMVKLHLENTPATRHFVADVQVRYVLSKAWPCADKKKGAGV